MSSFYKPCKFCEDEGFREALDELGEVCSGCGGSGITTSQLTVSQASGMVIQEIRAMGLIILKYAESLELDSEDGDG